MFETRDEITVDGFDFAVCITYDNDADPPWTQSDGHGDVRQCGRPHWQGEGQSTKKPGERPMNKPDRNHYQYYYDWAGACRKARKEGWNVEPYDAPNQVQRAVQADFDYLCGWVRGDWEYVVVDVTLCVRPEYERSIGGVETLKNYHMEFAEERAQEVIEEYLDDMEEGSLKGLEGEAPEGVEKNNLKGMEDVR